MMAVNFVDGGDRVSIFLIYRKLEWHSASEACTASHMSLAKNGIRDTWEMKMERQTIRIMGAWKTVYPAKECIFYPTHDENP